MDLQKMQYFKDAYELNSFTKAANKNFVQQSAITQQIAAIEKELGVLLFERQHGKIQPTVAGKIFYQECSEILEQFEHISREIKCYKNSNITRKKLTFGFSGFIEKQFMNTVQKYLQKYPEISVNFVEDTYSHLCEKLFNQEIDIVFGVACELEKIPGTVFQILYTETQEVLLSRENELARKDCLLNTSSRH